MGSIFKSAIVPKCRVFVCHHCEVLWELEVCIMFEVYTPFTNVGFVTVLLHEQEIGVTTHSRCTRMRANF